MLQSIFSLGWKDSTPLYRIVRLEIVPYSISHTFDTSGNLVCGMGKFDDPEREAEMTEEAPRTTLSPFSFHAIEESGDTEDGSLPDPVYINFSYDVVFKPSQTLWSERWDIYLTNARDSPLIHWFSIVNSLVVVLLLSALVAMILLRVLYRDISRYNDLLADEDDIEEKGWKLLHGDVFRKPAHSTILAALTGSGMQVRTLPQRCRTATRVLHNVVSQWVRAFKL